MIGKIEGGFVVFLGVGRNDTEDDLEFLATRIMNLRVFEDKAGKMNLTLKQVNGSILLVSQFTLYGDARKGNRPSFTEAALPDIARGYYEKMVGRLSAEIPVQTGLFQARMDIELTNSGPVTILLDSKKNF